MKLSHFFLPHPETHQKAHLISSGAIACYIALFIVLQMLFRLIVEIKPGVLGIASNVSQSELVRLTNQKRAENGLPPLTENAKLNSAAYEKGKNMIAENYWAHYSPSGKDPWSFILRAGYKFTSAGENLAKNFYSSGDIVDAWMASPTHKENILNPRYKDIGISIMEGELNGQPTVLVVQEFGTPVEAIAQLPQISTNTIKNNQLSAEPTSFPTAQPVVLSDQAGVKTESKLNNNILLDPFMVNKSFGFLIIFTVGLLTLVDLLVLRRRVVVRLSSRHLPHLALLAVAASTLFNTNIGAIL